MQTLLIRRLRLRVEVLNPLSQRMITKSGFTLWRITLLAFFLWGFTCCVFDNSDSKKGEMANRNFVPLNIGDTWKYHVTSYRQSHGNLLNEIDTGYRFIQIQRIANNLAADTVKILLKDSVYFRDGTYAGVRELIDTPIVQVAYITCYKTSRESIYVKVDSGSYIVGDGQNRMILANLFTEGIPESQKKDSVIQNFNRKIVDTSYSAPPFNQSGVIVEEIGVMTWFETFNDISYVSRRNFSLVSKNYLDFGN